RGLNLFRLWVLEQRGRAHHGNDLRAGRQVSEVERPPGGRGHPQRAAVIGNLRQVGDLHRLLRRWWRFLLSDRGRFWRLRLGLGRRTLRGLWRFLWSGEKRPCHGGEYNKS